MPNWFKMQGRRNSRRADIAIYSDIGYGLTAGDFREALEALGERDELRVDINSNGGDVFAGFAIYNMLNEHPARVIVRVQGLAASMASVIAMAGDEIEIAENGMFMIHNPWGVAMGGAESIASFAEALKRMRSGILRAYQRRTGQSRAQLRKWMDGETWFDARQSVEFGFADRVVDAVAMAARVDVSRFSNVPASLGRQLEDSKMTDKTQQRNKAKGKAHDEDLDFLADEEVDAEALKAEARKEVAETAKEIRALVALADEKPELAEEYIAAGKTPKEVTEDLTARREAKIKAEADKAAKGKGNQVSARNVGTDGSETNAIIDSGAIWARWNGPRKRA